MPLLKHVVWRAMTGADLDAVFAIANVVHPGFFEAAEVLAEKFALYPVGCRLLEVAGQASGYVLSHPWRLGALPELNALLGAIPAGADSFYIHDLALLPQARGAGAAGAIIAELTAQARGEGFATMSLVAVNNSLAFWTGQGFVAEDRPDLADKLAGYEEAARYMVKKLK